MILVTIGANLDGPDGSTPYQLCERAVDRIAELPGLQLVARSGWWRSAPVPRAAQPDYCNGVVRLEAAGGPEPEPALLLLALQAIERAHGRTRGVRNAARTLDLDIVAMGEGGELVRDRPDPVLPHPRAHERAFVLLPLRQVAPGWVHPRLGLDVAAMIAGLGPAELGPEAIGRFPQAPPRDRAEPGR